MQSCITFFLLFSSLDVQSIHLRLGGDAAAGVAVQSVSQIEPEPWLQ